MLNDNSIPLKDVLSIQKFTDSRTQVTTILMALIHEHTASYADRFPPFDSNAQVSLLIGINNEIALDTRVLLSGVYPLLHCTALGYGLVGRACASAVTKQS